MSICFGRPRKFLALIIKPVLKQMLNGPDSLQDLGIVSVNRLKGRATTSRVSVTYRARNSLVLYEILVGQKMKLRG